MDSMDFQFATLPLYDLAETRIQTDALWTGLASSFRRKGIKNVPDTLFRGEKTYQKKLFFGQICGFPLTHEYARRFKVIATPLYRTPYFTGPEYLSVITVHQQCKWQKLEDARGSRVVINSRSSHSGYNILRLMVTPFTKETTFFSKVSVSGAHLQSLSRIRQKQADLASIDGLTWSMLEMYAPEALKGCRILTLTPPAPAPAFVTEKETSQEMIELFRNALKNAFDEPKFNLVAKNLFLENTQIIPENAYDCITEMERISIEDL